MNDTPRTDKAQKEYEDENYDAAVYPEFARQLERELAAADKEIDRLNRYVDTFRSDEQLMGELKCAEAFHRCAVTERDAERHAVSALRAELAAKDAGIASLRAQLRDADKEMPRFHRLEDELAATQILLHESLIREDRFYRELAAKDTEKYCFASCAFHAAQDAEIARLRESLHDWTGKQEASK